MHLINNSFCCFMLLANDNNIAEIAERFIICAGWWSWVEINKEFIQLVAMMCRLAKATEALIHHQDGYDFTLLSALFSFRYPANPIGFSHKRYVRGNRQIRSKLLFCLLGFFLQAQYVFGGKLETRAKLNQRGKLKVIPFTREAI